MSRFQRRRQQLAARRMCTHCGREPAKPGCRWCPGCLAVDTAKRDIRDQDKRQERRSARITAKRQLLLAALDLTQQ